MPPGPRGGRILGSLGPLRNDPLTLFEQSVQRYGDLVAFRAAHLRVYLVAGGEMIAWVEVGNRDNYVKGVSYDALRIPIPDALLTADGAKWRQRRRMLMPVLSRRALLDRVPEIAAAVADMAEAWEGRADAGEPIDLTSEMNALAFDVVGRALIGTELREGMHQIGHLVEEASAWVARRTRALVPLPHRLPTPRNLRYHRCEREIRRFAEGLIASRRADRREDLVSGLIGASETSSEPLGDLALRDEVIGMLMAGYQTTGAALAWSWYLLGRHPEADERLAAEATSVLGGRPAGIDELERLVYAGQVLDEAMRLYPPGWAFTRTAVDDDQLGGFPIMAGSVLVVSSWANQRNPMLWSEPQRFDPDRFAPGAPKAAPYHYFPFGVGPHSCIGKHMALIEARIALAMLSERFRLELLDARRVRPNPGITLTPSEPILARVHRRE